MRFGLSSRPTSHRLSSAAEHRISKNATHDLVATDRPFVVEAIRRGIELARSRPESHHPRAQEWSHRLPESSSRFIDEALRRVEVATRSMDVEQFVSEFSNDVEQLDVNRRVRIRGREAWRQADAGHRRGAPMDGESSPRSPADRSAKSFGRDRMGRQRSWRSARQQQP